MQLDMIDNIYNKTYVSKDELLEEQKAQSEELASLISGLEGDQNPLFNSYRVNIRDLSLLTGTVMQIEEIEGIDKILAPDSVAEAFTSIKRAVSISGLFIVAILIVVSLVIIANTIKVTVFNRRKEINIMKYVGAKDSFIWLPFIVEGMILGGISALLSYGVLWYAYDSITKWLATSSSSWIAGISEAIIPFGNIWWCILIGFVVFGIGMGVFGSLISTRKYLKV